MHLQNRACQVRRAWQIYPARWRDLDFAIAQTGSARRLSSRCDRVADEDAARDAFRAQKTFHDRRRQVMAVNDEARPQIIIGQRLPNVIWVAIDLRVRSVAKVSRNPRPGARR